SLGQSNLTFGDNVVTSLKTGGNARLAAGAQAERDGADIDGLVLLDDVGLETGRGGLNRLAGYQHQWARRTKIDSHDDRFSWPQREGIIRKGGPCLEGTRA